MKKQRTTDIERVKALDDISRSGCCHSNETRAPVANPPTSAQLEGTPTIPKLYPSPCSSVGMQRETDRQTHRLTDTHTDKHTYARDQYISRRLRLTWNVITVLVQIAHMHHRSPTEQLRHKSKPIVITVRRILRRVVCLSVFNVGIGPIVTKQLNRSS